MKNPVIVFGVVAVIAVFGVGAYLFSQNSSNSEQMEKKDDAMVSKDVSIDTQEDTSMEKTDDDSMAQKNDSRYVVYSDAALDDSAVNRRVLFFYASWCPTCRPADLDFKTNSGKIPEDVTVIRVNYNDPETDQEEKDLARKYGITYQHTFVQIDNAGKEVSKWNGGQIDELLANIK